MSTATDVQFEFRCTTCYQTLLASADEAGTQTCCRYCGQTVAVPDPTPDRIQRAKEQIATAPLSSAALLPEAPPVAFPTASAAAKPQPGSAPLADDFANWSDNDVESELRRQLHVDPRDMVTLSTIASSRGKRFLGSLLDGFLLLLAVAAGYLALFGLITAGLIDGFAMGSRHINPPLMDWINSILVIYFPTVLLCLLQWNLIATRGQTLAKMALRMRIVTDGGRQPGFFQGVILRNWVTSLLSAIPFFGFLDAVWIFFNDERRCLHDVIAGTYVVDV